MPPSEAATQNTPLAPSVEKAYYRKCIALKRRLNEVESANDEAKIRRVRLDRAIMKMRLERAFLLDELRKRMEPNVDGSDGSGDEAMATPPPDRPHRDKRRKQQASQPTPQAGATAPADASQPHSYTPSATQRAASDPDPASSSAPDPPLVPGPGDQMVPANSVYEDGRPFYHDPAQARPPGSSAWPGLAPPQHASPGSNAGNAEAGSANGARPEDADGSEERAIDREGGATGEPLNAGPAIHEGPNGERRVENSTSAENAD